jgi:hypothetical protein
VSLILKGTSWKPDYLESIPKTKEVVPPTTSIQQHDLLQKYLETNWSGFCSQLPNISKLL